MKHWKKKRTRRRRVFPDYLGYVPRDAPCNACGYNLRGVSFDGHCPECGLAVRDAVATTHQRISHETLRLVRRATTIFAIWSICFTLGLTASICSRAGLMDAAIADIGQRRILLLIYWTLKIAELAATLAVVRALFLFRRSGPMKDVATGQLRSLHRVLGWGAWLPIIALGALVVFVVGTRHSPTNAMAIIQNLSTGLAFLGLPPLVLTYLSLLHRHLHDFRRALIAGIAAAALIMLHAWMLLTQLRLIAMRGDVVSLMIFSPLAVWTHTKTGWPIFGGATYELLGLAEVFVLIPLGIWVWTAAALFRARRAIDEYIRQSKATPVQHSP